MTLRINISPDLEARLKREASKSGVDEEEYARQLIEKNLAPAAPVRDQATLDLLAQWDAEDATNDPEEIARRQREWEEFRKSMNENSLSGRPGLSVNQFIILDSGPLANGNRMLVPELADYEVRRELIRIGKLAAIARLDKFNDAMPDRYIPLTTPAIRRAAEFWADSRRRGIPTADPKELDADVIIAAKAVACGYPLADLVVATSNPVHLSRFVKADLWTNI